MQLGRNPEIIKSCHTHTRRHDRMCVHAHTRTHTDGVSFLIVGMNRAGEESLVARTRKSGGPHSRIGTYSPGLKGRSWENTEHINYEAAEASFLSNCLLSGLTNKTWKLIARASQNEEVRGNDLREMETQQR